jgi:hypothetical protein
MTVTASRCAVPALIAETQRLASSGQTSSRGISAMNQLKMIIKGETK